MIILISPAKKQNFEPLDSKLSSKLISSELQHKPKTAQLVKVLKQLTPSQLAQKLGISPKLAELNHQRYQAFNLKYYTPENAKPALFAYQGDVYKNLAAESLTPSSIKFLQQHLLILSGLYGATHSLDLIQPYRLEMQTPLTLGNTTSLHEFWQDTITKTINAGLKQHKTKAVINLASQEYFKAVDLKQLSAPVITLHFKEMRQDKLRTIALNAKRARGMMLRFIAENKIKQLEKLKDFHAANYRFKPKLSSEQDWVFVK